MASTDSLPMTKGRGAPKHWAAAVRLRTFNSRIAEHSYAFTVSRLTPRPVATWVGISCSLADIRSYVALPYAKSVQAGLVALGLTRAGSVPCTVTVVPLRSMRMSRSTRRIHPKTRRFSLSTSQHTWVRP